MHLVMVVAQRLCWIHYQKKKFTTGMGYYACAQAISQAIGPVVGVFLRDTIGYHNIYIVFFFYHAWSDDINGKGTGCASKNNSIFFEMG